MLSTTLSRSAATLGVVAGLLAAAVPASAQILDGPVLAKAGPQREAGGYLATDPSSEADNSIRGDAQDTQASRASSLSGAGASFTLDVASSEVFELNTFGLTEHEGAADRGEVTGLVPNALGTQVGSEGVKAPTDNLRGEAIDIIPS